MNRYELQNAVEKVRGYYFPRPEEVVLGNTERAFDRAKAETIKHMEAAIARIRELTWEQFGGRPDNSPKSKVAP